MTEVEGLCAELICGDDERAEAAAARLADLGANSLPALRELLGSPDADARWWSVRTLAGFEDSALVLPELLAALVDGSEDVRQAAAMALGHHPQPQAVPALILALADPDPMTARLASNSLVLTGKAATLPLLETLKNGTPSSRLEAVRALAEIQDTASIPGLMKALETDSALMQYWAGLGLDKMGLGMIYLKPE